MNKARAKCLADIVIGAAESKSVLFSELATRVPGNAATTSKSRRRQDFFREVPLDFNAVAALLMGFVGKLTTEPPTLALYRTNWRARQNDVNPRSCCPALGHAVPQPRATMDSGKPRAGVQPALGEPE